MSWPLNELLYVDFTVTETRLSLSRGRYKGFPKFVVAPGKAHDATLLVQNGALDVPVLIDTGTEDQFGDLLKTEALAQAMTERRMEATIRMQKGYDHSYFFVATFMADHVAFHAGMLRA